MSEHYLKTELYERVRKDPYLFEWLQAGSLDGIWFWDIENPEHEWLSPRFKALFGYEDHEVPNTSAWWQKHIFAEDLPGVLRRFDRHIGHGEPYDQIVRYSHKDGSTVWVRCRGLAIRDSNGKPIRMLGAHTDVTELMKAKQELEAANDHLKEANQDLELFIRAASHDLQSPVRSARTLVSWTLADHAEAIPQAAKEDLEQVVASMERIASLLEALLGYCRIGHYQRRWSEVAIEQVIAETLNQCAIPDSMRITVPSTLPTILGPPAALYIIFGNLIGNAIKHHNREDGSIELTYRKVGDLHEFCVIDDGPGIDPKHQATIFEPFKKLEHSEGSGLGLAMVHNILSRLGGSITVRSALGAGSRFTFTWPKGKPRM